MADSITANFQVPKGARQPQTITFPPLWFAVITRFFSSKAAVGLWETCLLFLPICHLTILTKVLAFRVKVNFYKEDSSFLDSSNLFLALLQCNTDLSSLFLAVDTLWHRKWPNLPACCNEIWFFLDELFFFFFLSHKLVNLLGMSVLNLQPFEINARWCSLQRSDLFAIIWRSFYIVCQTLRHKCFGVSPPPPEDLKELFRSWNDETTHFSGKVNTRCQI